MNETRVCIDHTPTQPNPQAASPAGQPRMPPRTARRRGGGTEGDGTTERLKTEIREGPQQAYEALQTARALFARWEGQGQGGRARGMGAELAKAFAEAGEYKAALDLARLYMADNSTVRRPAAPAEAEEGGGGGGGIGGGGGGGSQQRVTELTPQEMQREKLAKALKERKQQAAAAAAQQQQQQQQQQQEEGEADPAMVEHRFGSGGREKMLAVAALLPKGSGERLSLLKGLARWAAEETGQAVPALGLLLELAEAYKEAGDYGQAAQRLSQAAAAPSSSLSSLAPAATAYAALLAEWSQQGYWGETDLFLARAVLHIVARAPSSLEQGGGAAAVVVMGYAKAVLEAAGAASPAMAAAAKESPLLHFVGVLLELLPNRHNQPGAAQAFQLLAERYRPSIDRDPDGIGRAVGRIAEGCFGIRPAPNPMEALLQSMMGSMGGLGGLGGGGLLGSMLGGGAGGGGGLLGALGGLGMGM